MENKIVRHIEVNGITYDVPTIDGFDLTELGYVGDNAINKYYKDAIDYSLNTIIPILEKKEVGRRFVSDTNLIIFPNATYYGNIQQIFSNCSNLELFPDEFDCPNLRTATMLFENCKSLRKIPYIDLNKIGANITLLGTFLYVGSNRGKIDTSALEKYDFENVVRLTDTFMGSAISVLPRLKNTHNITTIDYTAFYNCNLKTIEYMDIYSLSGSVSKQAFGKSLQVARFDRWRLCNIDFSGYSAFAVNSVKYLIFHSINSEDGATNRTLTLHATPLATWNNEISSATPTADDAEFLEVEDWDRYKKEDGTLYTWGEIASIIKDITIA